MQDRHDSPTALGDHERATLSLHIVFSAAQRIVSRESTTPLLKMNAGQSTQCSDHSLGTDVTDRIGCQQNSTNNVHVHVRMYM